MSISLLKGCHISLTKESPALNNIAVGLGWDAKKAGGGLLGLLRLGSDFDLDASVFMLDENDKLLSSKHFVYYGNLTSPEKSVQHQGDNLTGEGDGDDEVINIALSRLPAQIQKLVFVVNIYEALSREQNFGMVQNAFIRLVNQSNNQEIAHYHLNEAFSHETAMIFGEVYLSKGEWTFKAVGQGSTDDLNQMINLYT